MPSLPIIPAVLHGVVFLVAVAFLEHFNRRSRLPSAAWALLTGVLYGLATRFAWRGFPVLSVPAELVFFGMVPLLIFQSASTLHPRPLFREISVAGLLATVGMALTTGFIGSGIALGFDVPWPDALLFASVVSATDPIAVNAVVGDAPFPDRLRNLIEGESLLNDGTVVVAYTLLRSRALEGVSESAVAAAGGFLWGVGGAALLGAGIGYGAARLLALWRDTYDEFVDILMILATVYAGFVIGEHWLRVSGVITVMAATLMLVHAHIGRRHGDGPSNSCSDYFFHHFFGLLGRLVNTGLFFLLGAHIGGHEFLPYLSTIPAAIGLLVVSRAVVVYGLGGAASLAGHFLPASWRHVLNLAGVRGALSIALILMLPDGYQYREMFLCAAFVMILFGMVANSLLLATYIQRVDLKTPGKRG